MADGHARDQVSRAISRRDFIKVAAAAGLLAGCSPDPQPQATSIPSQVEGPTSPPTPTLAPTNTLEPEATPVPPTATPVPTDTPQALQKTPGKVARVRHAGAWDGDALAGEALRQMLDTSIASLTGIDDAGAAWAALFEPHERIAIKVNTARISNYWTHVPLVMALTECLQDAGVPAEQIVIFDQHSQELENAGFTINQDGAGVRCYGNDGNYSSGWTLLERDVNLSDILLDCDALINVPILKAHLIAGFTFALKNHYGTFSRPQDFHTEIERAIAELNGLPPIQERTRLIVGDALTISPVSWRRAVLGDSIITSVDPVAHDRAGLQVLPQAMAAEGVDHTMATSLGTRYLEESSALGLGVSDPDGIEWVEITL